MTTQAIRREVTAIEKEIKRQGKTISCFSKTYHQTLTPGRRRQLELKKKALMAKIGTLLWVSKEPVWEWDSYGNQMVFKGFRVVNGTCQTTLHGDLKRQNVQ